MPRTPQRWSIGACIESLASPLLDLLVQVLELVLARLSLHTLPLSKVEPYQPGSPFVETLPIKWAFQAKPSSTELCRGFAPEFAMLLLHTLPLTLWAWVVDPIVVGPLIDASIDALAHVLVCVPIRLALVPPLQPVLRPLVDPIL